MDKELLEKFDKGVFLVNVLGVIYNPKAKKVLIGRRKDDPFIENLSWVFPGGRPGIEKELEEYITEIVKEKTGLDVIPQKVVFAKTYPEKREFLSIYYFCEYHNPIGNEVPGDNIKELKWVNPNEVAKYFTTSLH